MSNLGVVIVSAGKGTRMRTEQSKQYIELQNKPILVHTLEQFHRIKEIKHIHVVVGTDDVKLVEGYKETYHLHKVTSVIPGGKERQDSVYKGLLSFDESIDWVMIHDGVRPFVTEDDIMSCWRKAEEKGAAVMAVPVKDTIKLVNENMDVLSTPERKQLWAIQTPQVFQLKELIKAHEYAKEQKLLGTDDAMLMEMVGASIHVVPGDYQNIKITTPDDLEYAQFILAKKSTSNNLGGEVLGRGGTQQ
ncbi:2-C-methyl-D-erythritol 4-phosphate cytidylyltransferase [Chengkuizengella sediminis]|uniref:2-C-methyl-D-erythritol 4-phosphate cytidylyltransferase n=1 Tax=Chengkuizengella sediminis TaxID=1885917 RepID=UPI0013898751|nr:2-C-methyl-D-erythritol 4-phosphate cytidylyltransferase [Chengkuizengella sediminis]NDI36965.1 2-C-methyl-D-erythritol 4-phosphate cytidylyltransferase [Chengkuizengella sediminis]